MEYQGKPNSTMCNSCALHLRRKSDCLHCGQLHRQSDGDFFDGMAWITCDTCLSWTHVACDPACDKMDRREALKAYKLKSKGEAAFFSCSNCTPKTTPRQPSNGNTTPNTDKVVVFSDKECETPNQIEVETKSQKRGPCGPLFISIPAPEIEGEKTYAEVRTTYTNLGKTCRWVRCTQEGCGKWRRLKRMAAFETMPSNWCCANLKNGSCFASQEELNDEMLLTPKLARRFYSKEEQQFRLHVMTYLQSIGKPLKKGQLQAKLGGRSLDFYKLYRMVTANGGCDKVVQKAGTWMKIFGNMYPNTKVTDASYRLKRLYKQFLYLYEQHFHFGIRYSKGSSDIVPYVNAPKALHKSSEWKNIERIASSRKRDREASTLSCAKRPKTTLMYKEDSAVVIPTSCFGR